MPKGVILILSVLVKYLGTQPRPAETQTEYIARVDAFAKQIEQAFDSTEWMDKNHPNLISMEHITRILMMALVVKANKVKVAEIFNYISAQTQLGQLDYMIKGYAETDPSSSQYVFSTRQQSLSPAGDTRQSRPRTRGRPNPSYRPRSVSRQNHNGIL